MTDLEDLRKRYGKGTVTCAGCRAPRTVPPGAECPSCGDVWSIVAKSHDPSVLALCDEVEALRAQVAQSAEARGVGEAQYLEAVHQLGAAIRERDEARAQVAAAPVVLREWPKTAKEAPGEWFLALHGARAPRGEFEPNGNRLPLFRDDDGDIWPPHEFEPGEFFVRVP